MAKLILKTGLHVFFLFMAVFGRLHTGNDIFFFPASADTSYVAKPTMNGYFAIELPPGECSVVSGGVSAKIFVPESGFLFVDLTPENALNNAIYQLQLLTGARAK